MNATHPQAHLTVPVAAEGETAAVSTTFWPKLEGFADEVRAVVVAAGLTA